MAPRRWRRWRGLLRHRAGPNHLRHVVQLLRPAGLLELARDLAELRGPDLHDPLLLGDRVRDDFFALLQVALEVEDLIALAVEVPRGVAPRALGVLSVYVDRTAQPGYRVLHARELFIHVGDREVAVHQLVLHLPNGAPRRGTGPAAR